MLESEYISRKDSIRALSPEDMSAAIRGIFSTEIPVTPIKAGNLRQVAKDYDGVVMPAEDISRFLAKEYLDGMNIQYESVFLRWDREAVHKEESAAAIANVSVSFEAIDQLFMRKAWDASKTSADWWRQLGGALVIDGALLYTATNQHTPHPQAPNAHGDPRSLFKRGIRIECSTAEHAEAALIAEAARQGVTTQGASLYVTTFPCPMCARLVGHAGVKYCYFATGYAVLDGAEEMRRHGVELIYVETKAPHG